MKKIFACLIVLFCLMFTGCASYTFELKDGIYICDGSKYFGELALNRISDEEFVSSKGLNVFEVNYDGEYRYFSINVYVTPIKGKKINLTFKNLEAEELHKITFKHYCFVDENGHMVNINEGFITISYVTDDVNVVNDFYKKATN